MGRILAIDYGTKRTGIAVSDPMQIIASPLETIPTQQLRDFISSYISAEDVDAVVVGMPKKLNNEATDSTQHVVGLIRSLRKQLSIPIEAVDERFTSKIALDAMIRGGASKKDRREKGNIDKVSAALILQTYLEKRTI